VAVDRFLTACQTYVLQANSDVIREVYTWILGRIATSGWDEPALLTPYFLVTVIVVLRYRRALDVLAVGDEEAASLGVNPQRVRLVVVLAASLGAAAAVAVSGLIGFVGIIVPHTVRLAFGASNRIVLPLSILFGGAFMVAADLVARTVLEPAELPIGVVTAFIGAPFFALVLRTSRREVW
jgi:iron complex transport system permease protein